MNFEIVLASNNKHKLQEVREILSPYKIIVYSPADLNLDIKWSEENGKSYFENALIKALDVAKVTSLPIIADDSGLEIEELENKPGIYSARFAELHGGHDKAIEFILNELKAKKSRKAKFFCNIVLLNLSEKPLIFEGITEGTIIDSPVGNMGFGYDPIFKCDELNKTYAELDNKSKNKVSHRYKALRKLITYLKINKLIP